jgi:heat shock protein HslJ
MRSLLSISLVLLILALAACGSPTAPAAPTPALATPEAVTDVLSGTSWQWVGLTDPAQQVQIENPTDYTVVFADGAIAVKADCNQSAGSYTPGTDGTISIELGATTMAACPPGSRSDQFLQNLGDTARYFFEGDTLFLELPADGGTLEFARFTGETSATAADGLTGTSWQWVRLTDPTQQVQIDNPAVYNVTFSSGTVNITADCNQAGASYSTNSNGLLNIEVGPSTLAACPPGSRSEQFLQNLGAVSNYFFQGDSLFMDMMADGGTMEFARFTPPAAVQPSPVQPTAVPPTAIPPTAVPPTAVPPTAVPPTPVPPSEDVVDVFSGTTWQWIRLSTPVEQAEIQNPGVYTLNFVEGRLNISADCNVAAGPYAVGTNQTLTITVETTTRAACPPGSRSDQFLSSLGAVSRFFFEGETLFLELAADGGTLEFTRFTGGSAPEPPAEPEQPIDVFSGVTWQWVGLTDPAQQVTIDNPDAYAITFEEGTVAITADCNQAGGTYAIGPNGSITITVANTTAALCQDGSRSEEFLQKLGSVVRYYFEGESLFLELATDGGTLEFKLP